MTVEPSRAVDAGCARVPDALRPLRPLAGERVATPTPSFRWRGADRARVELCADRACTTVTLRAEAQGGSWTPLAPLRAGLHFWRVVAGADVSAVRALEVPAAPLAYGCLRLLADFDGDGREEQVSVETPPRVRVRYAEGRRPETVLAFTGPASDAGPCAPGVRDAVMALQGTGDIDGDGFTDAVLSERWTERACGGSDDVYVRRYAVVAGGPQGLGPRMSWLPEDRAENVWVSSRVDPVGDIDDDGFADLTRSRTSELLGRCAPDFGSFVLFGGPGLCLTRSEARISSPGGATAVCDVDGDGVEELAARDRDSVFGLYETSGRRIRARPLPARCGAEALLYFDRCIPGVARPEADVRPIGDVNGDGLGDVESLLFDAPKAPTHRGSVTFYGAAGGFREDRCLVRR